MAAARRRGSVTRRERWVKKRRRGYYPGWWCRYTPPGGKRTWEKGGATRAEAEAKLARLLAGESAETGAVSPPPATEPTTSLVAPEADAGPAVRQCSDLSFAEFLADTYLADLKEDLKDHWYQTVHRMLMHAALHLGPKPMRAVTEGDIRALIAARRKAGNSAATVRKYAYQVEIAFAIAKKEKVIDTNPIRWARKKKDDGIRLPVIEEAVVLPDGYLGPSVMDTVFAAVHPAHYRPALIFLRETGLRPSEAKRLSRYTVESDLAAVAVTSGKSKNATRRVPLTERAKGVLRAIFAERRIVQLGSADLVFPGMDRHNLRKALRAAAKKVLGKPLRLYDLRHLFASEQVRAGVPIPTVAELLGHADGRLVLERYGKHQPKNYAEQAVRAVEAYRASEAAKAPAGTPQAQTA